MADDPRKDKMIDYRITRSTKDTALADDDFAFVLNRNGEIRAVQIPPDLDDDEELPYSADRFIALIADLGLVTKLTRTYH